jgi:hypothetical protein
MADASLVNDSWAYYRDKYYSRIFALEEQYPNLVKKTPELQFAVCQIKAAEALIDKVMDDLEQEARTDDTD